MPRLIGDKVAVSKAELIGTGLFPSYEALKKKLQRDENVTWGIKRIKRGGNGRQLWVDYDTLPKRYQKLIPDPRIKEHILLEYYQQDKETANYYHDFTYPDDQPLMPDTIDQLIVNAHTLKSLIHLETARKAERLNKGYSPRGIIKTLFEDVHNFTECQFNHFGVRHSLNTSYRRFKEQFTAFKTQGEIAIIKDPFGNSKMNAKKRTEKTEQLLRNLLAGRTTKPTPTEVANEYEAFLAGYVDIINKVTGELYNPKEFGKIKQGAITKFLSKWDSKIGTDAKRSGNRQKLINDKIPHFSFERPVLAGSLISIDDRQPPFEYEKGKRMWWYIGVDVASEAIVAWAYGKTKEELIINFYRNLTENCAKWDIELPAEVECESHLNSSFTNSFLQDGAMFEKVTMYRNNARSKIIERFFEELRYRYEKKHIGWLARPHARNEANQSGPQEKEIIPYDKLIQQCFGDILKWNNSAAKGNKISRFDYFLQNQNPNLVPTNYKSFMKDLAPSRKTSCNAGIVQLNREEWLLGSNGSIATGEQLIQIMRNAEGQMLDTRFLKDAKGCIYRAMAYDGKNGRYICDLVSKPRGMRGFKEETPEHKEAKLQLTKYARTVTNYMRLQKNTIEEVEVVNHKPQTISSSFTIDDFYEPPETPLVKKEELPVNSDSDIDNDFEQHFNNDPIDLL